VALLNLFYLFIVFFKRFFNLRNKYNIKTPYSQGFWKIFCWGSPRCIYYTSGGNLRQVLTQRYSIIIYTMPILVKQKFFSPLSVNEGHIVYIAEATVNPLQAR